MNNILRKKGGQLSKVPAQSAVQLKTWARLTSEFEMGSGITTPLWPSKTEKPHFIYKAFPFFR